MKRQIGSVLLSCAVGAALLSGCTVTISPAASGASSDAVVQSEQEAEVPSSNDPAVSEPTAPEPTASEQAAQPTASPVSPPAWAPEESSALPSAGSTPADDLEYTDLSFLTEEQQDLYQKAENACWFLFGVPDNIVDFVDSPSFRWIEHNDSIEYPSGYILYGNSYKEFRDYIYSVFTSDCIESLGPYYTDKFIDYNGYLAASCSNELILGYVEGITVPVLDNYPDTYRLQSQDDQTVRFILISHYDGDLTTWPDVEPITVEYPICMVNTAAGWRMDEFHTTMFG